MRTPAVCWDCRKLQSRLHSFLLYIIYLFIHLSIFYIFGRQVTLLSFPISCGINCPLCYLKPWVAICSSFYLFIYYISLSKLYTLLGSSQGWHVERPHSLSHSHPWAREIPRLTCLAWRATPTWHSMKNTRWLIPRVHATTAADSQAADASHSFIHSLIRCELLLFSEYSWCGASQSAHHPSALILSSVCVWTQKRHRGLNKVEWTLLFSVSLWTIFLQKKEMVYRHKQRRERRWRLALQKGRMVKTNSSELWASAPYHATNLSKKKPELNKK